MEKKPSSSQKLEAFFAGKGFYVVLFLCAAVIGVSAWAMLSNPGTGDNNTAVSDSSISDFNPVIKDDYPPQDFEQHSEDEAVNGYVSEDIAAAEAVQAPARQSETMQEGQDTQAGDNPAQDEASGEASGEAAGEASDETLPEDSQDSSMLADEQAEAAASTDLSQVTPIFSWPVIGEIETPFAVTSLIYSKTMGDWRTHNGIDITAELGAHVSAVSAGTVENIYTDDMNGVTVVIDHQGGLKSVYSNLAEVPTVYMGDSVIAGEVIGAVGATSIGEGGLAPHLHLTMTMDGTAIDPNDYLPQIAS